MSDQSNASTVTVSGHGVAATVPDVITLSIGVEATKESMLDSYQASASALTKIREALVGVGIQPAQLASQGLYLRAETTWQEGRGSVVTGYTSGSDLRVTVGQAELVQSALDAVIRSGGNDVRVNNLSRGIANPGNAAEQARAAAWEDATERASQYAQLSQASLGKVLSVREVSENGNSPAPKFAARAALVEDSMPIEAGEQNYSAGVEITWELVYS